MKQRRGIVPLTALVLAALVQRADANFHVMIIVEVYPGSYLNPDAQYVMLQSLAAGQNVLSGHQIITFNPDGTRGPDFGAFTANPTNAASGAHYLMATSQAQTFFNLAPDAVASGRLPFPSGRVCFAPSTLGCSGYIDCVAYGAYTGDNAGFGTPSSGLVRQKALVHASINFTCPRNNTTDFASAAPNPINSANASSPDRDGDGVPDASDCAPGVSDVYARPLEASNLGAKRDAVSPFVVHLTWDDQSLLVGPSTVYDLVSGDIGGLLTPTPFAGAICLATGLASPAFDDGRPDPAPGKGVYYLSRATNGCGDGTYGDSTLSPDPRDFLDDAATTPCP